MEDKNFKQLHLLKVFCDSPKNHLSTKRFISVLSVLLETSNPKSWSPFSAQTVTMKLQKYFAVFSWTSHLRLARWYLLGLVGELVHSIHSLRLEKLLEYILGENPTSLKFSKDSNLWPRSTSTTAAGAILSGENGLASCVGSICCLSCSVIQFRDRNSSASSH